MPLFLTIQTQLKKSYLPFLMLISLSLFLFSQSALATVKIEQWQTKGGAKVLYVHAPELAMLDIQVAFDAGSARDGEQWGLASMTTTLLGLKTSQYEETELSQKINDLGAQIGGGAGRDSIYFSLRTLTRDAILTPALSLFNATLTDSVFDQAIFDREQQRRLVGLKRQSLNPSTVASQVFWSELYGDHPYAHPVYGTVEKIEALKLTDLEAFYKQYMVTENAYIAIVGNVDKQQAKAISEQILKGLPKGEKPEPIAAPVALSKAKETIIDFDASQTHFKQGQIGVERGHPDYYALFLGNHLLGGSGFGSLLMEEVREKRGLVYGVGSGFSPMKQPGPWLVSLSTKNDSAFEAKKVVNDTLKAFMKDFEQSHFEAIKDNLIGGFPLRIDSNGKTISYIGMIGFYGLPLNYLEEFPKKIKALTKQQVLDAWNRHIDPNKMLTIMVGKPE
ncbi:FIG015287: Zinc protease [hydrothermal vent metagenome]|uniref:FIG015287: Zinc protease n=1 Tax=hydrothermal vent metagenome TaxID=652676 RepID=A0A3B0W5Y2_9ZZZZ